MAIFIDCCRVYSGSSTKSMGIMVPLAGAITVELQDGLGRAGLRKKQITSRLISPRTAVEPQVSFGRHQFSAVARQNEPSSPTEIIEYPSWWIRNFWKIFDNSGFRHISISSGSTWIARS